MNNRELTKDECKNIYAGFIASIPLIAAVTGVVGALGSLTAGGIALSNTIAKRK